MIPFVVEHHLKASRKTPGVASLNNELTATFVDIPPQLVFETCMRRMIIHPWGEAPVKVTGEAPVKITGEAPAISGGEAPATADDDAHQISGAAAYAFLLEVLTGIQSPVFGETEVFAQFKDFWLKAQGLSHAQFFAPWAKSLIEDTKKIRSEFFRDGTTQTWGGVVRRSLRAFPEVWIIGNGELALSVAAALKEKETVFWARREKPGLPGRHHAWGSTPTAGAKPRALVICAPLTDTEVSALESLKGTAFEWIADLREVSSNRQAFVDFNLKDVEEQSEVYRVRTEQIREQAKTRILTLAEKSVDALWHRPMGWEDLCG